MKIDLKMMRKRNWETASLATTVLLFLAAFVPAQAQILGFGDGSNYTLNGYDQPDGVDITNADDPATISNGVLTITTADAGEGRSAYYNTPVSVAGFTASFVYQDNLTGESGVGVADGFTFVIQTESLNAIGAAAPALGYAGSGSINPISPSAADEFYLRNGTGATEYGINGSGAFADAVSSDPVDLADGDPILIQLTYDDTAKTLTEILTDELNPSDTYTTTGAIDITGAVGDMAYVGFTGGTGGGYTLQTISNFTFNAVAVPEPNLFVLIAIGMLGCGLLQVRARRLNS